MDEKNLENEQHLEDVLIMSERLASLYYHMVKNIIDEVGEEKAEKLVKKIVFDYGYECGENARLKVESMGLKADFENYHLAHDLPSKGWNNSGCKTTFCPFASSWKKRGFEKWGRLYCYVDQAKYEGYNENLECFHDKNLLDDDECCIIRVENSGK